MGYGLTPIKNELVKKKKVLLDRNFSTQLSSLCYAVGPYYYFLNRSLPIFYIVVFIW